MLTGARFRTLAGFFCRLRQVGDAGESAWTPFIVLAQALVIVSPAAIVIAVLTYAAYVAA